MKLALKPILRWILYVISFVTLVVVLLFFLAWIPLRNETKDDQPKIVSLVNEYHQCLEKNGWANCYSFTSANFQKVATPETLAVSEENIKRRLGKRLSGEVDLKSIKMKKSAGTHGKTKIVRVNVKTIYENDPFVVETFSLVFDSQSSQYKVDDFQISSKLF